MTILVWSSRVRVVTSGVVTDLASDMQVWAEKSPIYQRWERNNPWRWCVTLTLRK